MPAETIICAQLFDDALRETVLGADLPLRPDSLPDHRLRARASGGVLEPCAGRTARIGRVALTPEQGARLDHYTGALSHDADEGTDWDPARWTPQDWDLARAVAADIMSLYGHVPAGQIAPRIGSLRARAWSRVLAGQDPDPGDARPDAAQARVQDLRPAHLGFFRFDTVRLQIPGFDGVLSPPQDRELYVSMDAALVLPYDPATDHVLLVEQFRLGPWRRGAPHPWSLEPVAGLVDPGETPETCARREAAEEAGLTLDGLESIARGYASPGYSTGYFHMFAALCDLSDRGGYRGGLREEGEDIRTHLLALDDALGMMDSGRINVVPLQVMLLWLARHRTRLRGG